MSLNVSVTDFYRRVLNASPPPLLSPILWFLPSCSLLKSRPDRAHSLEYAPVGRLACIGCQNGLVCVFDLRRQGSGGAGGSGAGQGVVGEASVLEHSRHDPVRDVFWISSKTGHQCVSISTDGQMLWWDTRPLTQPTDALQRWYHPNTITAPGRVS
jgi:hypothetical protein